jgi:hypothetical protein
LPILAIVRRFGILALFAIFSQFVDLGLVGNFNGFEPILEKLSNFGKLWLSADLNRIC